MPNRHPRPIERGPFQADQIRPGDPYELSRGHPIECLPTGGRGSRANRVGAQVLGTDPAVDEVGIDTGYAIEQDTLRAPDVAVGNVPDRPGWVKGVPPLAVEYADTGQDEGELKDKIEQLLAFGTRWVWVVRLTGPRRVEVHRRDESMVLALPGEVLEAPGVLHNSVPVEALYDEGAANAATLRNLLQRHGYNSVAQIRAEGKEEGRAEGKEEGRAEGRLESLRESLIQVMEAKGFQLEDSQRRTIDACVESALLTQWLRRAGVASSAAEVFSEEMTR